MFNKKGVSLITVLLFMLIATIAGTATYKWLSSAHGSSASRMNIAEAQQASNAGLDAVRAWMTYHANDVGAVMRQYIDGGNKPVRLDNVVKAFGSHKQDYSVWLTGVEASTQPYRLKITSVGTARNGVATYSENAILKVNGLYRVKIPEKLMGLHFNDAFAGQHSGITSSDTLESGLITGDFDANNTPVLTSEMVITGDATYGGTINPLGDTYVKGDLEIKGTPTFGNEATTDMVVYVGGDLTCPDGNTMTVHGDLYVGGNVVGCFLDVKGNFTVGGTIDVADNKDAVKIEVAKNMVFTKDAVLNYNTNPYGGSFFPISKIIVKGNLYLPKTIEAHCSSSATGGPCGDSESKRTITVTGKVYRYKVHHTPYYEILNNAIYMQGTTEANVSANRRITSITAASFESEEINAWDKNDPVLKNVNGKYWAQIEKMQAYGRLIVDNAIPQPLLVDHEEQWKEKTANSLCAGIADDGNFYMDNDAIDALNNCYASLSSSQLYNGFLIIKWNDSEKKEPTHTLDHKFVFYSTVSANHEVYLPPTSDEGMVFLYLEAGTSSKLAGNQGQEYNYVIFSKDDIAEIYQLRLKGTMIMETGTELLRAQGGTHLMFDEEVVSAMVQAGLIRENPDYTKLVDPSADPAAAGVANAGTDDAYYVSTAPQLNISLESRYKNKEIDPATLDESKRTDIQASLLVMPRIIYVTQDLVGKLSDYYNVLRLNKAVYNSEGSVSCSPGGLDPEMKYDGKTMVPEDIYNCNYQSKTYGDNPFYVVVKGKRGKVPAVTFETPNWAKIDAGGSSATVNMLVKQATGSATMNVGVNVYGLPESWTLTPQTGVSAQSVSSGVDGVASYLVTFKANEAKKPLFKISAPSNAEAATVHFELAEPLSGCTIGTPSSFDVSVSGSVTVNRVVVPPSYCEGHTTITASDNTDYNCSSVTSPDWPNCDNQTGIWVYPYCNSLTTITDNDSWTCGTNYAIRLLKHNISSNCLAFIPDTSLNAENGKTYTLYGSLKRKPYKLYVKTVGTVGTVTPVISSRKSDADDFTTLSPVGTDGDYQVYQVYADYRVQAVAPENSSNQHKYWECRGSDCSVNDGIISHSTAEYLISGVDTLVAHYNERDQHCFFDSFNRQKNSRGVEEDFAMWCPSNTYYENCLDRCKDKYHCSVGVEGKTYEGYNSEANWMLIYTNSGAKKTNVCLKWGLVFCLKYQHEYRSFTKPSTIGGSIGELIFDNGLLRAPGAYDLDILGLFDNYAPTFMLNRARAGTNGKMSLKMKLPFDGTSILQNLNIFEDGDDLNDGAVIRSDSAGNSYLAVTLYKGFPISDKSYGARVRVCYVEGQDNDGSDCLDTNLVNKYDGSYVPLTSLSDVSLNITLDGASLMVDLDYNTAFVAAGSHDLGFASFDLSQLNNKSLSYGAEGHEYVGMKMFNPYYRYKDISWSSETYSDSCFNTPRIYCSFANKYLGGTVPKDSNVTPWVGMSSWFVNNGDCKNIEYYYNGCDMSSSLYERGFSYLGTAFNCSDEGGIGAFWDEGSKLKSNVYNFQDEGYHRIDTSRAMAIFSNLRLSGYAKNASVELTCGSTTYSTDCGQFYVGDIVPCSKHERSFEQSKNCGNDPCDVEMPEGQYANLREAKVSMTISGLNGSSVRAYLIDQNNVASSPYPISEDGTYEFNAVYLTADKVGFDLQNVSSVRFEGASGFTVSGLQSYCSNAPGIFDCTASFDGSNFVISSTITNTINAKKNGCTVSNDVENSNVEGVIQDCPPNGTFYVSASDVYDDLVAETSKDYSFTITMTDKEEVETSCQTNTVTVKKTTMSCGDDAVIDAGENLPAFTYYFENCPSGGCNATVELYGKEGELLDEQSVLYNKNCTENISCEALSWTPSGVNTAAGTYKYLLKYPSLDDCEATIKVNEVIPARATECKVENGVFTAKITAPSSGAALAKLWYGDLLGNMIGSEQTISEYTNYSQEVNLTDASYTLVLTLNGTAACTVAYPDGGSSSGESGNGSDSQNSGDNSGENSGDNSGGNSGDNSSQNNSSSVSATCSYTTNNTTGSVTYSISNVSGCDNNDCSIVVKRDDVDVNMGSTSLGNTGMSSSPIDQNGTYTVYLNGSTMDNCTFTVTMVENNNSGDNNNGNGNNEDDDTPSDPPVVNPSTTEEIEIKQNTVLKKGTTYKITGCDKGGSRIQMGNIRFKNCVDVFGTGGTYWYNNDNDCGGEIFVTYPITVTIPNTADLKISGCGN